MARKIKLDKLKSTKAWRVPKPLRLLTSYLCTTVGGFVYPDGAIFVPAYDGALFRNKDGLTADETQPIRYFSAHNPRRLADTYGHVDFKSGDVHVINSSLDYTIPVR